jgi:hypothetical protein
LTKLRKEREEFELSVGQKHREEVAQLGADWNDKEQVYKLELSSKTSR